MELRRNKAGHAHDKDMRMTELFYRDRLATVVKNKIFLKKGPPGYGASQGLSLLGNSQ